MKLRCGLAGGVVLAALVAGCGSDTPESTGTTPAATTIGGPGTSGPPDTAPASTGAPGTSTVGTGAGAAIEHPREADAAVIRVEIAGGFVPAGADFAEVPMLIVAGDGAVYQPGVTTSEFPGPLVRPVSVSRLTEDGIQRLLGRAAEADLLGPPPDYAGANNVADAPDTVVAIDAGGGVFVHRAYALGLETAEPSSPARETLGEFVEQLGDLPAVVGEAALGPDTLFVPDAYRIRAIPVEEVEADAMDPVPAKVGWPDSVGIELRTATECATVSADSVGGLFSDAKENTLFTEGDGETASLYRLAVVPVLPGDTPC